MPQRTCLGCRGVREQGELLRLARGPAGELLPDLEGRLPGRGAYSCFARACLEAALRPKALERGFRGPARAPGLASFVAALVGGIDRKVAGLLGMARRAGRLAAGRSAVEESLAECRLLLWAEDAGADARRFAGGGGAPGRALPGLSRERLGELLGRRPVALVGVRDDGIARALLGWLERRESVAGGPFDKARAET